MASSLARSLTRFAGTVAGVTTAKAPIQAGSSMLFLQVRDATAFHKWNKTHKLVVKKHQKAKAARRRNNYATPFDLYEKITKEEFITYVLTHAAFLCQLSALSERSKDYSNIERSLPYHRSPFNLLFKSRWPRPAVIASETIDYVEPAPQLIHTKLRQMPAFEKNPY